MTSQLLTSRSLGRTGPQEFRLSESIRLLYALQPAPYVRFDSSKSSDDAAAGSEASLQAWAHRAGVNSLALEKFESRFLLTGGADASIALWDLTAAPTPTHPSSLSPLTHAASTVVPKTAHGHRYGITHVTWWPFDSYTFLSSSYDRSLHLYATPDLSPSSRPAASFTLPGAIHSHALSPLASSHLLVACATQQPAVRLLDLRSGAATHSLAAAAGGQGAVLSVAWSPRSEHVLASAAADGSVRLWDVRRSAASLGALDADDAEGILSSSLGADVNDPRRRAHVGPANGLAWTPTGEFLVSAGHDAKIRVWDAGTGANSLVHFGPRVRNAALGAVLPVVLPESATGYGREALLFPSGDDVLLCDLREGDTIARLKVPRSKRTGAGGGGGKGGRGTAKAVVWREGYVEAYSAHADGTVRAWWPRTEEDVEAERDEREEEEGRLAEEMEAQGGDDGERKRKRDALDQIFRDLTRQKITFT